jgi:hypothetical protein
MSRKPDFKVVKVDGETGRKSTVSRTTTSDAMWAKKAEHRAKTAFGSSDAFHTDTIKHRK